MTTTHITINKQHEGVFVLLSGMEVDDRDGIREKANKLGVAIYLHQVIYLLPIYRGRVTQVQIQAQRFINASINCVTLLIFAETQDGDLLEIISKVTDSLFTLGFKLSDTAIVSVLYNVYMHRILYTEIPGSLDCCTIDASHPYLQSVHRLAAHVQSEIL